MKDLLSLLKQLINYLATLLDGISGKFGINITELGKCLSAWQGLISNEAVSLIMRQMNMLKVGVFLVSLSFRVSVSEDDRCYVRVGHMLW